MKKSIILFMIAVLFIGGCSKVSTTKEVSDTEEDKEAAMGRYIETQLETRDFSKILDVKRIEDGSLRLYDAVSGYYASRDEGVTWENLLSPKTKEELREYISKVSIAKDGSMFMKYSVMQAGKTENDTQMIYHYFHTDKAGEITRFQLQLPETEYFDDFLYLSDGRLVGTFNGILYEIGMDGTLTTLCEGLPKFQEGIEQVGDYLFLPQDDKVQLYHLKENRWEAEDKVLSDFYRKEMTGTGKTFHNSNDINERIVVKGGDANTIYLLTKTGLYRHVIGGTAIEQFINGQLCSIGNPSYQLNTMIVKENQEFQVFYDEGRSSYYTYDATVSTVPEHEIKVFSLRESKTVRQGISSYQQKYPDVYVDYQVGLAKGSSVTQEDALRNLNIQLMAGDGPDVLILDEMPIRTYANKGVLADLSPILSEAASQNTFFEPILKAYEEDNVIPAAVVKFRIPMLLAPKNQSQENTSLEQFADTLDQMREAQPEEKLLGAYTAEEVLLYFYDICGVEFVNADGSIDLVKLWEFLTQAQRIWKAEEKGISEENRLLHEQMLFGNLTATGFTLEENLLNTGNGVMNKISDSQQIILASVGDISDDYSFLISLKQNDPELEIKHLLEESTFYPKCIVGITSTSNETERAGEFVKSLLSQEIQETFGQDGFPVNQKAFEHLSQNKIGEDRKYGALGVSTPKGIFTIDHYWPSEEDLKSLRKMIESLTTPANADQRIKSVILELAPAALRGERSIESVIDEIQNKIQIYLAE